MKAALEQVLKTVVEEHPEVESAYLFGSTAQGKETASSDLDIAIRCSPGLSPESYFDLKLALMDAVEKDLGRQADVVALNTASLTMIRQVLRHGVLLYTNSRAGEAEYAARKRREYFDFRYYLDRDRTSLRSFYGVV